jgi:Ca2+-binding RTX toxin-like protein
MLKLTGFDVLFAAAGTWGNDTILDADGLGAIQIGSDTLNGGKQLSKNLWESEDKRYLYTLQTDASGSSNLIMGGNDYLEGGTGNDTYVYQTGDGLDTILDSDGQGRIAIEGRQAGNLGLIMSGAVADRIATKSIATSAYSKGAGGRFGSQTRAMNDTNWRAAA